MTASASVSRAGRLDCVCEPGVLDRTDTDRRGVALLAIGFALSILSQVLTLSILPLAGLAFAPSRSLSTLPFTAFYAGAVLASLPASLLLDSFGRRAAFSLGASLGAAGGLILVWALIKMHFGALVLGAFWLGTAGGFSLFYRHAAVPMGGRGGRAALLVFGAATIAAIIAPTLATKADSLSTHAFVGIAVVASLTHLLTLACTAALPYRRLRQRLLSEHSAPLRWQWLALPTGISALAWFLMTGLMGATPIAMVGCGLSEAVPETIAWHIMAMYAPSLVLACAPTVIRPAHVAATAALLLGIAVLAFTMSSGVLGFSVATVLLGTGWSLATLGSTLWLHGAGEPSRWQLGTHDGIVLTGALIGAITAGILATP
ncbi:hypothetical protein [Microvirga subterranea]|uniref:MFS transporter n=1 Tax=Microvirga subterranea TaxID=186651 RepID=A0A370HTB4_9HYPH|nr:hypothetical protein [Microvirga subterranea]RDI61191.1 hypothetical protein DES45_102586 [Microvirga subterranea]